MTPSVSVVIATYNYGRFLRSALESALNQTHRDLEVIVVDDGSTDDTPTVMEPFLAEPRVRYHRTEHLGQPGAKNAGIRLCRASLIAFLDADDLWLPTKIEKQLALFASNPKLGVAYTQRSLMDEFGHPLEYRQPACHRGQVLSEMYLTNFVCFSSVMVRREVFDTVGLFDERLKLAIDYDLWLRTAKEFEFDYVLEPLVTYRVGHANLSRRFGERLRTVRRIRKRFLNDHGGRKLLLPALLRRAHAEVCCQTSLAYLPRSRCDAMRWLLKAIACCPTYTPAWHGLLSAPMPESLRRRVRRLLGRPEQWNVHRRLPIARGAA
jgi:glycosyltransferase involved in cell wall biosynthesis